MYRKGSGGQRGDDSFKPGDQKIPLCDSDIYKHEWGDDCNPLDIQKETVPGRK